MLHLCVSVRVFTGGRLRSTHGFRNSANTPSSAGEDGEPCCSLLDRISHLEGVSTCSTTSSSGMGMDKRQKDMEDRTYEVRSMDICPRQSYCIRISYTGLCRVRGVSFGLVRGRAHVSRSSFFSPGLGLYNPRSGSRLFKPSVSIGQSSRSE